MSQLSEHIKTLAEHTLSFNICSDAFYFIL